ncbi:MAG: hypothetical protein Q9188_004058 [Gyalolechia gomerana]
MPRPVASEPQLLLAWAVQISLPQLAAQLVAYIDTRASITTFRLSARYTPSKAFGQLPEEIILQIGDRVRDAVFQREIKSWAKIDRCLTNTCSTTTSHVSPADRKKLPLPTSSTIAAGPMKKAFSDGSGQCHAERQARCYSMLTKPHSRSKMAKRIRVFARDFDIRPYFMLNRTYNTDRYASKVDAKAYLILPLVQVPLLSTHGDEDPTPTFAVNSTIDLSLLTNLTDNQLQKFKVAAMTLKLHPIHANDDEVVYEEKRVGESMDKGGLEDNDGDGYGEQEKASRCIDGIKDLDGNLLRSTITPSESQELPKTKQEKTSLRPQLMLLGCGEVTY